jgi:arylsulfatase A-like enzyme
MWAPGRIPAGTETAEITSTLDLLPSIATIAGIELQTRGPIDGHDLFAHIHGKAPSPRDELLYYSSRGELDGIRRGEWKFCYAGKERKPELYHLIDDIGERNNLAAAMPEKVAELKERMTALDTEMSQSIRPRGIHQP